MRKLKRRRLAEDLNILLKSWQTECEHDRRYLYSSLFVVLYFGGFAALAYYCLISVDVIMQF